MSNKLEILVRKAGRVLEENQIAKLFKVPEEFRQTPCDFFGYTRQGRAILMEAKMVNRISLPVGNAPGLAPHQWVSLLEANKANCLALIAWQRKDEIAVFDTDMAIELMGDRKSVPWNKIPDRFIHNTGELVTLFEPYLTKPLSLS